MPSPNFVLLYVDNPLASAELYTELLETAPVESSKTFVMFALSSGVMLGLWSRHTAEPRPVAEAGGGELAFALDSDDAVNALHARWSSLGLPIVQAPTRLDFGHTFVALDPDGHRLRVFAPSGS